MNQRITLDLPVSLNVEINEQVKKTALSKAAYIRMALEVMNMVVDKKGSKLILIDGKSETELFIPGVHNR